MGPSAPSCGELGAGSEVGKEKGVDEEVDEEVEVEEQEGEMCSEWGSSDRDESDDDRERKVGSLATVGSTPTS